MSKLTIYCDHVSDNHVHCNKYAVIPIEDEQTFEDAVKESYWTIDDAGNIYCQEHN